MRKSEDFYFGLGHVYLRLATFREILVAGIALIFIDLFSESQYLCLHLSLQYSSVVLYP